MNYDYNTSRKDLPLPEYGRNVQKMVDHLLTIEDREKRNRMANTLISIMGNLNPHLRDVADFKHKLWDHLAVMSDFALDIDSPYETPTREKLSEAPRIVPYPQSRIKYKHYGKSTEVLIAKANTMEEGEEKDALVEIIANHMKKQYLTWNKNAVLDRTIFKDLNEISELPINIDPEKMKLVEVKDVVQKPQRMNKKFQRGRKKN